MNHPYLPANARRRPLRRSSQLLPLEQRFMFDGAAVADAEHAAQAHDAAVVVAVPPALQVRAAEPARDEGKKEVVLVDTSLSNYKTLEAGVRDGVGIVEFDGSKDGLAQIAQWAAQQGGYDAIHILSHGSAGVLTLGTSNLSAASLEQASVRAELAQLGQALNSDGDLLLYGCDIAAGQGNTLLAGLAHATGADVAASTDLTGAAHLGGNWTLEARSGDIGVRELALVQYDAALTLVTIVDGDLPGGTHHQTFNKDLDGKTLTFTSPNMAIDAADMLNPGDADLTGAADLTISMQAGSAFDVTSFKMIADANVHIVITYANGSTDSIDLAGTGAITTITSADFGGKSTGFITQLRITSSTYVGLQNFELTARNAPTATVISAKLNSDTGADGTDFITMTAGQTISGTLSSALLSGEWIEVSYNNGSTWSNATTFSDHSASWSTVTTLAGSNTFQVRVANVLGHGTARIQAYQLDNSAPTNTIASASFSADTGDSPSDFITKTASQNINGTLGGALAAGEQVYVSIDNGASWTSAGTATGATSWSLVRTLTTTSTLQVKISDTAGNDSAVLSQFYTFDTTAPTITFSNLGLSADTGTSNSDFVTRTAAQTITATLSGAATGNTVWGSIDNGNSWTNITSKVSGTTLTWTGVTLSAGNTIKLKVSDVAGNDGTIAAQVYTVDTTAPTISFSGIGLSADNGLLSNDLITNTAGQTVTATLSNTLSAGDKVEASVDGGATWTTVTSKVAGTTLTWDTATLASGSNTLAFRVTDLAGNAGNASTQAYTLDTTAPTTTVASVSFNHDSGTYDNDFITNVAGQTISGTLSSGLGADERVLVSLDNGATWNAATIATNATNWTLDATLASAINTLKVKVSDNAGNDGTVASRGYQYDTTAPTITFSALALSSDSGTGGDFITNTGAQTITATLSGALSAGNILYGSLDGGTNWIDITSQVSGTALTWTGVTLAGSSSLQLKVADAAGNDGTVRSQTYQIDSSAPATPTITLDSDNGASSSDGITSDNTPTLSGTAESGVTVKLYDGVTHLADVLATGGSWSYTTTGLSDGSHSFTAVAVDRADNSSAATAVLAVTVDTGAPTVGSVGVPASGTYYTGDALDFTVNFNENVLVTTTGGTPYIALTLDTGGTVFAYYSGGSGSSALTFRYTVVNGNADANGITVGALSLNGGALKDSADNNASTTLNSVGSTTSVLVDGSQPSITNVNSSTANGSYGASQVITITLTFSAAVDVDTSNGTPTLALNDGGTASYTGGSGTGTLSFSYTVGAGSNSADLDVASTGALSLNLATITDAGGSHRAASLVLATPGTAGSLGANRDIVIDTTAPGITGDTLSFSNDSGAADLITKTAAQTIDGTLTGSLGAGEGVEVSLDNGASWTTATTAAGSSWQLAGATLSGSNTLKVRVVDAAGNRGAAASYGYTLDTTAPVISFSNLALSHDNGTSHSDFITNAASQTITATLSAAPAGSDVVYGSLDNGNTWIDITSKVSGTTLTWDNAILSGSDNIKLRVTDAADNNGAATTQAYVLSTTSPTTSVASAQFSADSGNSNGDFITKTAAQTVSGTLSANLASGESVLVSLDNGATWSSATTTVGADGWTVNGTLTASDTLLVKVVDLAGNDGTIFSQGYTYDVTAPVAATVNTQTTNSLTPVLSGSATLGPGDQMTVTVGGATYDVVPVAGAWMLDLASAVPASGALKLVLNNQYSVLVAITDVAGNSSNDATNGELIVGTLAQPATPPTTTVAGATLSSDSGASNSDFITNIAQQTISGSLSALLQVGERVEVSLDGGASWSNASASGSSWSFSATLAGSGSLQVRVSGDGGNGAVYSRAYTLDSTPPAAPLADAVSSSSLTPVLNGAATLADGETLSVAVGGANYAVGVVNGRWTLDLASATPASGALSLAAGGSYSVVATVTDLAGNRSSGSSALTINPLPGVTSMTLSADSGSSNSDFITNLAAQTISGGLSAPLAADQTVQLSLDGGATWQNASVSGTSWSASVTLSGSNTLVARVASAGDNSASLARAYVLDTSAPVATPVLGTQTADGAISGSLSAPLGNGESVLVSRDNGSTWSTFSSSGQAWSLSLNGASSALLQVRDAAGNAGSTLTVSALPTTPTEPEVPPPPVRPETPVQPEVPQQPTTAGPITIITPGTPVETPAGPDTPGAPQPVAPVVLPPASGGNDIITTWPGQTPPTVIDTLPTFVALQPMPEIQSLTGNAFQILTLPELSGSAALVAYTPIPDIASGSGEQISVQIGSDAFARSGDSANVTLSAQMADGTTLPGWLRFDARTARFEGTPPPAFEGTLSFRVTARDSQGRAATQVFKIVVGKDGAKTGYWQGEPADTVGRASLGEQMRSARSSAAARLVALSS